MTGVINMLKPTGMTSHDVVAFLRRVTGEKRIGHAGTLDPAAAGVLVVCLGRATRLVELFMDHPKTYVAGVAFGAETDTGDAEGQVCQTAEKIPSLKEISIAMKGFIGEIQQTPSPYAAIKIKGVPAYVHARRNEAVDMPSRTVTIHEWSLLGQEESFHTQSQETLSGQEDDAHAQSQKAFQEKENCAPARLHVNTRVVCSKGTYVRTLAQDLARGLGSRAHLYALVRTRSGPFDIEQAVTCEQVLALAERNELAQVLAPPEIVLAEYPVFQVPPEWQQRVKNGNACMIKMPHEGFVRMMLGDALFALGVSDGKSVAVRAMLAE